MRSWIRNLVPIQPSSSINSLQNASENTRVALDVRLESKKQIPNYLHEKLEKTTT